MSGRNLNNLVDEWLAARQWKLFLFGLPALLALGAIILTTTMIVIHPASEYPARYKRVVRVLLAEHRFEDAQVACFRGLSQAGNEQEVAQWLFFMAVAVNGLGNESLAQNLIAAAAPLDRPGCVDAQFMVAESMLSTTNLTSAAIAAARLNPTNEVAMLLQHAERHLLNALITDPASLQVNEALGRFYLKTHQFEKARPYLLKIYAAKPDIALLLAVCSDLESNESAAIQWSDRAIAAYEDNLIKSAPRYNPDDRRGLVQALMIKSKHTAFNATVQPSNVVITNAVPQDSPQIWLGIVQLLLAKGKLGEAMVTLDQQMLVNSNALYGQALGNLCASWAQSISPKTADDWVKRLQLVEKGLKSSPDNLTLRFLLAQSTHAPDPSGPEAQKLMDQLMAQARGKSAAMWEFILWNYLGQGGNLVDARPHLQKAYQLDPENPQIQNDVAFQLLAGSREDQTRGLAIIQSVLERYPGEATFVDTRGQLLAALGRYQEARSDLEFAATRLKDNSDTRRALNKVYSALGITPVAPAPDELLAARAFMRNEQFQPALDLLEKTGRTSPNPAFSTAIAEVCAAWLERLSPLSTNRLALIEKGLQADPANSDLQKYLVQTLHAPGEAGREARQLIDHLVGISTGEAAGQWHLLLGRDARARGDHAGARQHLETAYQLSPGSTEIQVELARILSAGDLKDLQPALNLIQPAVDQFPENPEFLNIRGQILARLGRNEAAVADLEFAAPRLADPQPAWLALAKVYDAMGKTQSAERARHNAGTGKL